MTGTWKFLPLAAALALAAAASACGAHATAAPPTATGRASPAQVRDGAFASAALKGTDHFRVYLPRGYSSGALRYPVIYLLHGLPGDATSYQTKRIDSVGAAAEESGRPAIVVSPQGARPGDTDPEWLDWGPGRDWATATADELVAYVDRHYRTIGDRRGRAIIGLSAGGYGATSIGLHNPATYSVIQSWSGYFRPTNPSGSAPLDLGSAKANHQANLHNYVDSVERMYAKYRPTYFAFYVGDADPHFVPENEQLHRELIAAKVPHVYAFYPGAHTNGFWDEHEEAWISAATHELTAAR
ncbi:MAG TPA: alpha/beta hydrolase-fold protein [Streptosporangiaceae bacterium]